MQTVTINFWSLTVFALTLSGLMLATWGSIRFYRYRQARKLETPPPRPGSVEWEEQHRKVY